MIEDKSNQHIQQLSNICSFKLLFISPKRKGEEYLKSVLNGGATENNPVCSWYLPQAFGPLSIWILNQMSLLQNLTYHRENCPIITASSHSTLKVQNQAAIHSKPKISAGTNLIEDNVIPGDNVITSITIAISPYKVSSQCLGIATHHIICCKQNPSNLQNTFQSIFTCLYRCA